MGRREEIREAFFGYKHILQRLEQLESKNVHTSNNEVTNQEISNSVMMKQISELQEIKDKRLNVILYGLDDEQAEDNINTVNEVLKCVNPDVINYRVTRLGKSNLQKISFNNNTDRISILKNSKVLKLHPSYNKIYVNADLTRDQLAANKKLRENLKAQRILNPGKTFLIKN